MMHVTLAPQRRDDTLEIQRARSVLTLNGQAVDLASYDPETAANDWIIGQPMLVEGIWQVVLILPHGSEAPEATRFPAPIILDTDGPVPLPPA